MRPVSANHEQLDVALRYANHVVYKVIGRLDDDLAQDAAEAMVKAMHSYSESDNDSPVAWMLWKARMAVIERVRSDRPGGKGRQRFTLQPLLDGIDHPFDDPGYGRIENGDLAINLLRRKLPLFKQERDRTIVTRALLGEKQDELAAEYGVYETYVSQLVVRFRKSVG